MNPSLCSAIVLHLPQSRPYRIDGDCDAADSQEPIYTALLQSVFGQVSVVSRSADVLLQVQQWRRELETPILCLVDLDTIDEANDQDDNDHCDKYTSSSSCSHSSSPSSSLLGHQDPRTTIISELSTSLNALTENSVPVVAVSEMTDDFAFMLACMHAGAIEYLTKPLRLDNVKTLFLKAYRPQSNSKMHHDVGSPSTVSTTTTATTMTPVTPTTPNSVYDGHDRIKDMITKDTLLTKAIMDMYVPSLGRHENIPPLSSHRVSFIRFKISSWDFCPFDFDPDELIHCTYFILEQALESPQLSTMAIPQAQLYDFIVDLAGTYRAANPYHNFAHAVDVLQCLYYFMCQFGILPFAGPGNHSIPQSNVSSTTSKPQYLLKPTDILALLIAAIGHDAAHPGVNNMFMINSATPLALLYNDRSVLENFHSMTLFHILRKHGFDQSIGVSHYQEFRKTVVSSILATDMALHNDYVVKFKQQATRLHDMTDIHALDAAAAEQERMLLCSALIKCADISNVTRPFRRAYTWAELLAEEFAGQGDLERELGMPVQPTNDRGTMVLEDMQIGFIRYVAVGLFDVVSQVVHEMSFALEFVQENLDQWEKIKRGEVDATKDSITKKKTKEGEEEAAADHPTSEITSESLAYRIEPAIPLHHRRSLDGAPHTAISNTNTDPALNGIAQLPTMAMSNYTPYGSQPSVAPTWRAPALDSVYCQCSIM